MDAKDLLFVGLAVALVFYGTTLLRGGFSMPTPLQSAVGFVTAFLDTLGIGSFATTTAAYKLRKMVPVKQIPGTMNVGHTLATIAQAFIYTKIVPVDSETLIPMITAACLGAWIGAGVVVHWPRRRIQIGMGTALLVAAPLIVLTALKIIPGGGAAFGLTPTRLAIGMAGNFAFGALMMLGIGLYAPCMILVALLGMDPRAAFPIMMGSCAFLMPICSIRFVRARTYHVQASWGLALGGFPAVLIAAYIVRSLPLGAVSWLVAAVVIYTSLNMLLTARTEDPAAESRMA
ncbi:MAG TPA: sulfite exporter TauE/SafE family protein [Vicinamibacterales bacterium]